jgi:hypothetical protein
MFNHYKGKPFVKLDICLPVDRGISCCGVPLCRPSIRKPCNIVGVGSGKQQLAFGEVAPCRRPTFGAGMGSCISPELSVVDS